MRSRASCLRNSASTALAVVLARHVDEVDDDDAAQVAQPQLPRDRLRRLEVGLEDRVVEVARADEAAGVDVDRRQRLGLVDDQVAARLQVDAARQRLARSPRRCCTGRRSAARPCNAAAWPTAAGMNSRPKACSSLELLAASRCGSTASRRRPGRAARAAARLRSWCSSDAGRRRAARARGCAAQVLRR